MDKMLRNYDRLTGFGHRVDVSALKKRLDGETLSDRAFDRELMLEKLNQVEATLEEIEEEDLSDARSLHGYNNVVGRRLTSVTIFDDGAQDGDRVRVLLNGEVVENDITVTKQGVSVDLTLRAGPNEVEFVALNEGTDSPNTLRVAFGDNLYGSESYPFDLFTNQSRSFTIGLPIITINGLFAPEAARHIQDYLTQFRPNDDGIWTLSRNNRDTVAQRRDLAQSLYRFTEGNDPVSPISNFDLDEVPFASLEEGGVSFVRPIPASDNQHRFSWNAKRPKMVSP